MTVRARLTWLACLLFVWNGGAATGWSTPQASVRATPDQDDATFTVAGRVLDERGQPIRNVTLWIGRESEGGFSAESCQVEDDGNFVSPGLTPGTYVIDAAAASGSTDAAPTLSGFAIVALKRTNLTGVAVTLRPAPVVSGRVTFEAERNVDAIHPRVNVRGVLAIERMRENHSTVAMAGEDGVFTLGPVHGPRLIRADAERGSSSAPWWLKTVSLDGVDVTNVPIDFSTRPSARLEVVFSDRPTAVVGIVHDEAGLPVEAARVVLFSKDPGMWAAWSTAVQAGISDENGRFWFVDAMPGGDYRAIALRDSPASIAETVDELPRLEKLAMPVVVTASKVARIEVVVSRLR